MIEKELKYCFPYISNVYNVPVYESFCIFLWCIILVFMTQVLWWKYVTALQKYFQQFS